MAYTEPFLYFVEYIFGKYAAKLYLCSQIQDNDETFMYLSLIHI